MVKIGVFGDFFKTRTESALNLCEMQVICNDYLYTLHICTDITGLERVNCEENLRKL